MIVTKFCHPELYKLAKSTLVLANFSFFKLRHKVWGGGLLLSTPAAYEMKHL